MGLKNGYVGRDEKGLPDKKHNVKRPKPREGMVLYGICK